MLQQPTFYQPATTLYCFRTLYKPTDSTDLTVRCLAWHIYTSHQQPEQGVLLCLKFVIRPMQQL